jgi:hypothetical protein
MPLVRERGRDLLLNRWMVSLRRREREACVLRARRPGASVKVHNSTAKQEET